MFSSNFDYLIIFQMTLGCKLYVEWGSIISFSLLLGRLEDQYVIRFIREKLKSMPCRNQGYILDGFPKTYDQAKDLFSRKFIYLHSDETQLYCSE